MKSWAGRARGRFERICPRHTLFMSSLFLKRLICRGGNSAFSQTEIGSSAIIYLLYKYVLQLSWDILKICLYQKTYIYKNTPTNYKLINISTKNFFVSKIHMASYKLTIAGHNFFYVFISINSHCLLGSLR